MIMLNDDMVVSSASPLLGAKSKNEHPASSTTTNSKRGLWLLLLLAFVIFLSLAGKIKYYSSWSTSISVSSRGNEDYALSSLPPYPWLTKSYDGVVEPWRTTTLVATGCSATCRWWVDDEEIEERGAEVQTTFTSVGSSRVVVRASSGGWLGVQRKGQATFAVRYVRREIRSLTEADREAFFSSMVAVWNVSTTEGLERFGGNFAGMDSLNRIHAAEAGLDK